MLKDVFMDFCVYHSWKKKRFKYVLKLGQDVSVNDFEAENLGKQFKV